MGMIYKVTAQLDAAFNKENIGKVLTQGAYNAMVYYKILDPGLPLNVEAASNEIVEGDKEDINYLPGISVFINNENDFDILFSKNEPTGNLEIRASPSIAEKKAFINDYNAVDFASYINFILMICKDFKILELETQVQ